MKAIVAIFGFLLIIQMVDHAIAGKEYKNCSILCRNCLKICGLRCYNPELYSCIDGLVCGHGLKKCGQKCYDPKEQTCFNVTNCEDFILLLKTYSLYLINNKISILVYFY